MGRTPGAKNKSTLEKTTPYEPPRRESEIIQTGNSSSLLAFLPSLNREKFGNIAIGYCGKYEAYFAVSQADGAAWLCRKCSEKKAGPQCETCKDRPDTPSVCEKRTRMTGALSSCTGCKDCRRIEPTGQEVAAHAQVVDEIQKERARHGLLFVDAHERTTLIRDSEGRVVFTNRKPTGLKSPRGRKSLLDWWLSYTESAQ